MSSPEFTDDGIVIQTLSEIIEELEDGYKGIYGDNINVDSDSPDGQRIGIEAQARLDVQSLALSIANAMDPDIAEATHLDRIIKICGITRMPATRSTWDISVTVDRDVDLLGGYQIEDDIGQLWETTSAVSLSSGTTAVTFTSSDYGEVSGLSTSTFVQSDVVIGVTGFSVPADATEGTNEETDEELRDRRNLSLQKASHSTVGGLYARLADLGSVTDLVIYENDTAATDTTRSIAANTVWCVVEGGEIADIVEVIAKNKTAGCGLKGTVTGDFIETLDRPSGATFTITHTMAFDRPTDVPLYINVTATRTTSTSTIDTDSIKEEIAEAVFPIGVNAAASKLYAYGYNSASNYILSDMEISDDDITYTDDSLSPGYDGKFTIDTANITITEVI